MNEKKALVFAMNVVKMGRDTLKCSADANSTNRRTHRMKTKYRIVFLPRKRRSEVIFLQLLCWVKKKKQHKIQYVCRRLICQQDFLKTSDQMGNDEKLSSSRPSRVENRNTPAELVTVVDSLDFKFFTDSTALFVLPRLFFYHMNHTCSII